MTLLSSCWFIIKTVIIPDGFRKWICLSFFIHPLILFACQVFLWLKLIKEWLLFVALYPPRIIFIFGSYIFGICKNWFICFLNFFSLSTRLREDEYIPEVEKSESLQICNYNRIVGSHVMSSVLLCKIVTLAIQHEVFEEEKDCADDSVPHEEDENMEGPTSRIVGSHIMSSVSLCRIPTLAIQHEVFEEDRDCADDSVPHEEDENMEGPTPNLDDEDTSEKEYLLCDSNSSTEYENENSTKCLPACSPNSQDEDTYVDEFTPSVSTSGLQIMERKVDAAQDHKEGSDAFYKKYTERMRWFDMLNYDRTCGTSAILNKQLGGPSLMENSEPPNSIVPYISWSNKDKRRLLRSLESDFEMVYVAQSCLSWEALHHQYRKAKALESSSSQTNIFNKNGATEFQKFQVLLERFMEDEQPEGKRVWNYVQRRFSLKSLLQVPEISVFLEEDKGEMKEERINVKQVLKAIEECIQAYWMFVKTDSKKCWWKICSSLWSNPPVEDPRDLELLADLTNRLQKKKIGMKDLRGKKKCLIKRIVKPMEESQRTEMLFTMIDIKLVSRVLQMVMVSSSQLKWCQQKLDNFDFIDGKVVRTSTSTLFPPS